MSESRRNLIKLLYLAASGCLEPEFRTDSEAIKTFRDAQCDKLFGVVSYKELTNAQMRDMINELNIISGHTHPSQLAAPRFASAAQQKNLRYLAIACAIEFAKMDTWWHTDKGDDMSGEEVRVWLRKEFDKSKHFLPKTLYNMLYSTWINRKCNQFMIEGKFKTYVKTENSFFIQKLHTDECNYLIQRFQQIYGNCKQGVRHEEVSSNISEN